jgi:hypothetical protein
MFHFTPWVFGMSGLRQSDKEASASNKNKPPSILRDTIIRHLQDLPVRVVALIPKATYKLLQQRATTLGEPGDILHNYNIGVGFLDESSHLKDQLISWVFTTVLSRQRREALTRGAPGQYIQAALWDLRKNFLAFDQPNILSNKMCTRVIGDVRIYYARIVVHSDTNRQARVA